MVLPETEYQFVTKKWFRTFPLKRRLGTIRFISNWKSGDYIKTGARLTNRRPYFFTTSYWSMPSWRRPVRKSAVTETWNLLDFIWIR